MKLALLAGSVGLALLSSAALAQDARPLGGTGSPLDRQFATEASASNTFEIRSSMMALRRSRDPAVRDMARWMIESHTAAERKLQGAATYADYAGEAAPVETPTTSGALADLGQLEGAAFDKAYVDAQVAAHETAERQMQDYTQTGSYGPLLAYDAAALPEVRDHLAHFERLKAGLSRGSDS